LGRETSLNELARIIERVAAREVHILHVHAESGGVNRLVADLTLARRWLNYTPAVDLETGLRLLLEQDAQFQVAVSHGQRSQPSA
jgi:UDP-glucose 4-epimerase